MPFCLSLPNFPRRRKISASDSSDTVSIASTLSSPEEPPVSATKNEGKASVESTTFDSPSKTTTATSPTPPLHNSEKLDLQSKLETPMMDVSSLFPSLRDLEQALQDQRFRHAVSAAKTASHHLETSDIDKKGLNDYKAAIKSIQQTINRFVEQGIGRPGNVTVVESTECFAALKRVVSALRVLREDMEDNQALGRLGAWLNDIPPHALDSLTSLVPRFARAADQIQYGQRTLPGGGFSFKATGVSIVESGSIGSGYHSAMGSSQHSSSPRSGQSQIDVHDNPALAAQFINSGAWPFSSASDPHENMRTNRNDLGAGVANLTPAMNWTFGNSSFTTSGRPFPNSGAPGWTTAGNAGRSASSGSRVDSGAAWNGTYRRSQTGASANRSAQRESHSSGNNSQIIMADGDFSIPGQNIRFSNTTSIVPAGGQTNLFSNNRVMHFSNTTYR